MTVYVEHEGLRYHAHIAHPNLERPMVSVGCERDECGWGNWDARLGMIVDWKQQRAPLPDEVLLALESEIKKPRGWRSLLPR